MCILKYQGLCNCIKAHFRKNKINLQHLPIMCYPYKLLQIHILTKFGIKVELKLNIFEHKWNSWKDFLV